MFGVDSLVHIDFERETVLLGPLFRDAFEAVSLGIEFDIEPLGDIDGFPLGQAFDIGLIEGAGVNEGALLSFAMRIR